MLALLRWLFIVLLIYYIIKIIARIFFPILFKKMVNNAQQRMKDQQQRHQQNQHTSETKVGETIIDKKPKQSGTDKNVGEYIDYEEVD
jgi:flagellar biosynthesis/type III secretory pathway M-ring protein FliF/YscJ